MSSVFQFWCIIPWFLILHYKSRIANYTLLSLLFIFSIGLTIYLAYHNDFKVGVLAFENLQSNVFDRVIKSPFTKLHLFLLSFSFSRFYLALQKHKLRLKEPMYPLIARVYKRESYLFTGALWGVFLMIFCTYLFIGRNALINPYAWTRWQNTLFYGFAKFMIYFCLLFLMFILMTDNSPAIKKLFKMRYLAVFSKLAV